MKSESQKNTVGDPTANKQKRGRNIKDIKK